MADSKLKKVVYGIQFLLILGIFVSLIGIGVQLINYSDYIKDKYCIDSSVIMTRYCDTDKFYPHCFNLVSEVERLLKLETEAAIFNTLKAMEPQTDPVKYWAVVLEGENERSHLDTFANDVVSQFENPAYYYTKDSHVDSVRCGGWSLSFWKIPKVYTSIQVSFCKLNDPNTIRVCGAFDIRTDSTNSTLG